jgi:hypothetical protein
LKAPLRSRVEGFSCNLACLYEAGIIGSFADHCQDLEAQLESGWNEGLRFLTPERKNSGYMSSSGHTSAYNDGIHDTGLDEEKLVPITRFVYPDEATPPVSEKPLTIAEVSSAFSNVIDWIVTPQAPNMIAARSLTMKLWLDPIRSRHRSLLRIAQECDVSRAALSKALLAFRDEYSIGLTIGRLESSREIFRQAQLASIENGTHASFSRKNANLNTNSDTMDYSVKDRYPTLDRATDRIAELESKLPEVKESKTAPVTTPIEALTASELEQAMRLANKQGNGDLVKALLREWHRRK